MAIAASRALYIKLGGGNDWAQLAFETDTVRFGFGNCSHEIALACASSGDFAPARTVFQSSGGNPGTATRHANEVREFYTAGADVLWITFADNRLWWCFAAPEVIWNATGNRAKEGDRYRKVLGSWSNKDSSGQTLWMNQLRGSLTVTANFRGTICRVREFDYLLRRLNGAETAATQAVRGARLALVESLVPLIRGLHWKDFELLAELVVTQAGWRRVSATGGAQHTIDLELEQPLTDQRALVQVKSFLDPGKADDIAAKLVEAAGGRRAFLVYHTPDAVALATEDVEMIDARKLAARVVDCGLTAWVMEKVG